MAQQPSKVEVLSGQYPDYYLPSLKGIQPGDRNISPLTIKQINTGIINWDHNTLQIDGKFISHQLEIMGTVKAIKGQINDKNELCRLNLEINDNTGDINAIIYCYHEKEDEMKRINSDLWLSIYIWCIFVKYLVYIC